MSTDNTDSSPIDPRRWMSSLPNNALLSRITLPGTHDSIARYGYGSVCQDEDLATQLANGIRVFDIRLRYLKGSDGRVNFSVHHSDDYQYAFLDSLYGGYGSDCKTFVLDDCLKFLAENNQETIVLMIKQEKDVQKAIVFFDAFWNIVGNRDGYNGKPLNDLFYAGRTVPRLGDIRGRIVLVFVDGDEGKKDADYKLSNPARGLYWGNIDYSVDASNPGPDQVANLDVENHYSDIMSAKWDKVSAHLQKTFDTGPSATNQYVTYISASRTPDVTHFPRSYADYLLPMLETWLGTHLQVPRNKVPWGAHFGIVMMDFPTPSIIRQLILASRGYHYV
ncbi:hypothetical protein [Corallococcus terminator]|uniref:1-phosphatidylinositol phosphodiesterase n=1 Tax=Corallococcus terminator TaxID=2316733 RepID=A0A3A8JCD1_9BACT|nr:hypothetical protein [Corallococcus terminator]RKG93339.1 hypothetical protein D7V88_03085 [Corallococcus terminator]